MNAICISNEGNCWCVFPLQIGETYTILDETTNDNDELCYIIEGHERSRAFCRAAYIAKNFVPVMNAEQQKKHEAIQLSEVGAETVKSILKKHLGL